MTILVPDELAAELQKMVSDGEYPDPESAIRAAVRLLTDAHAHARIVESIREAERNIEEGHGIPECDKFWDTIMVNGRRKIARGHKPDPDVVPG